MLKITKMYHLQKLKEEELAREREENAAAGEDGKKESLPPIVCIYFISFFLILYSFTFTVWVYIVLLHV